MTTRESIIETIQKMPEPYLPELYEVIKNYKASKKKVHVKASLMSKLRSIKISAPSDFSQTVDLYSTRPKPDFRSFRNFGSLKKTLNSRRRILKKA